MSDQGIVYKIAIQDSSDVLGGELAHCILIGRYQFFKADTIQSGVSLS
jgi:hypothetical protein